MMNKDAFQLGIALANGDDPAKAIERLGLDPGVALPVIEGFRPLVLLPGHEILTVYMPAKHRTKIAREALERGVDMTEFASRVLATVARDGLFGAVLD